MRIKLNFLILFCTISCYGFGQSSQNAERPVVSIHLAQPEKQLEAYDDTLMISVTITNESKKPIKIPKKLNFYPHKMRFGAMIVEVLRDGVPDEEVTKSHVFVRYRLNYFPEIEKIRRHKTFTFESNLTRYIRLFQKGTYKMRVQLSAPELKDKRFTDFEPAYSNWITIVVANDSKLEKPKNLD